MTRLVVILVSAIMFACSSAPPPLDRATPRDAAIAILRADFDLDTGAFEYSKVCSGAATGPRTVVTANHCAPELAVPIVDAYLWDTTTDAVLGARVAERRGELAFLETALPLRAWVATMRAPRDGPATMVLFQGTAIVETQTELVGPEFTTEVKHGDSGSGIYQGRALVGVAESCHAPNPDNGTNCLPTGGSFTPVAP